MVQDEKFNFVIILGAARSGTTMLANLLKKDKRVIYVGEPKYVWKYKNFRVGHDMLTKEHITPEIRDYITCFFNQQFFKNNGDILLEKTPSNSLRFEFVYNLFPNAKFIHIIRNGIPAAISAKKRWCGEYTKTEKLYRPNLTEIRSATNKRTRKRWFDKKGRFLDLLLDLNYTIPLYMNNIGLLKHSVWGPVYPGMWKDYKKLDLIDVCSLQWKHSVESVLKFKNSASFNGHYFEIRYEDILEGNAEKVQEMFEFANVDMNSKSESYFQSIKENYQQNTHSLSTTDEEIQHILKQCRKTLKSLRYL